MKSTPILPNVEAGVDMPAIAFAFPPPHLDVSVFKILCSLEEVG